MAKEPSRVVKSHFLNDYSEPHVIIGITTICLAGRVNKAWYHLPGQSRVT
jgi:hypothetical protein